MTVSVRLPESIANKLAAYCRAHGTSKTEVIRKALVEFLAAEVSYLTPYELGKRGFGGNRTNSGDIARHSKELLRKRFRS